MTNEPNNPVHACFHVHRFIYTAVCPCVWASMGMGMCFLCMYFPMYFHVHTSFGPSSVYRWVMLTCDPKEQKLSRIKWYMMGGLTFLGLDTVEAGWGGHHTVLHQPVALLVVFCVVETEKALEFPSTRLWVLRCSLTPE